MKQEGTKRIQVTAAVIRENGRVLLSKRPHGSRHAGAWEFPGGKREKGESLEGCLKREIMEELEMPIENLTFLLSVDYDYPDLSLTLHAFLCEPNKGATPNSGETIWVEPIQLSEYDLLPPDMTIAEFLINNADSGIPNPAR